VPCPAQNIAQAKKLIAATGLKTPINVSLMVPNDPLNLQLGSIIQSMAKQAGFAVSLQPLEFTTTLTRAAAGQFELYDVGWSGRVDPDQNIFSDWYPGASTSTPQRQQLYTQAVQLMHSELNIIYLYYPKFFLGLSKNVTGVQFLPDSLIRLEFAQAG
jgi:peptide/nickel transport system substrate-binding protein